MALKGTLTADGISEALHLITFQHLAGVLRLANGKESILLHVKDRAIIGIEAPGRAHEHRLGELLVSTKLLPRAELDRALAEQRQRNKPLGEIVTALGLVSQEALREVLEMQATETLHALFDWTEGQYEVDPREPESFGLEPRSIETVLLDGARRLQEWPIIREKIPSLEQTFDRLREIPGAVEEVDSGDDDGIDFEMPSDPNNEPTAFERIDASALRVARLVQPGRTVQEIIRLSRLGAFETSRALASLISAGYLRAHEAPVERAKRSLFSPLYASIVLIVFAAVVAQVSPHAKPARTLDAYRAQREMQVIKSALEVYRLRTGSYPHALAQLVDAGMLRPHDVISPNDRPYDFSLAADGTVLLAQPAISQ